MLRLSYALLVCTTLSVFSSNLHAEDAKGEWKTIFNGKDLTGWDGDPRLWSVKDGVIHGETTAENAANGNTFLIWQGGETGDFELKITFRCNATNNSGIQYRSAHITEGNPRNKWVVRGYQHEIRNENEFPNISGFIYDEGGKRGRMCMVGEKVVWDTEKHVDPVPVITQEEFIENFRLNDWNEVRIVAKGHNLQHFMNGKQILDCTDNHPEWARTSGVLALQLHAGKPMWAEYKDIQIRALK